MLHSMLDVLLKVIFVVYDISMMDFNSELHIRVQFENYFTKVHECSNFKCL